MDKILQMALFGALGGFLYRWGGGGYDNLIWPFNVGWKPARRYLLPAAIALFTGWYVQMALFSIFLHFGLDEIESRDWETVALYGFAHAWCFYRAGWISGLLGAWWICGVWISNVGWPQDLWDLFRHKKDVQTWRLDWFWVELAHGFLIGLLIII